MLKVIACDFDDTLVLERKFIYSGFSACARFLSERFSRLDEASLKNLFLREFERSTRGVFDRATEVIFAGENSDFIKDKAAELIDVYRTHKPSISYEKDVHEFLKGMRAHGLKSAVITDGNPTTQRNKLKAVGAFDDFDEIVITSEHGSDWAKPSVKAFLHIAHHFCVRPDEIAYIGDNPAKDFAFRAYIPITTIRINRPGAVHSGNLYLNGIEEQFSVVSLVDIFSLLGL